MLCYILVTFYLELQQRLVINIVRAKLALLTLLDPGHVYIFWSRLCQSDVKSILEQCAG